MYVNVIFAVLALFPFGKKIVTISLIAFPFLTTVVTYLVDGISSGQIEMTLGNGVGGVGDRTHMYVSGEQMVSNVFGVIGKFIQCIPQYLTIFYLYNKVMVVKIFGGTNVCKYLFRLTYIAFYIASLFLFVETSSWICERFKYMGFFPMVFVLGAVWSRERRLGKWARAIYYYRHFQFFSCWLCRQKIGTK